MVEMVEMERRDEEGLEEGIEILQDKRISILHQGVKYTTAKPLQVTLKYVELKLSKSNVRCELVRQKVPAFCLLWLGKWRENLQVLDTIGGKSQEKEEFHPGEEIIRHMVVWKEVTERLETDPTNKELAKRRTEQESLLEECPQATLDFIIENIASIVGWGKKLDLVIDEVLVANWYVWASGIVKC
jgi:hypothetical protein